MTIGIKKPIPTPIRLMFDEIEVAIGLSFGLNQTSDNLEGKLVRKG